MKPTVIVINGSPRTGKDTFARAAVNILNWTGHTASFISSIDKTKYFAELMGWNGKKSVKMRQMLSDLKCLYIKYFDGPTKDILAEVYKYQFLFVMIREPDEIKKLESICRVQGIKFHTVIIYRNDVKNIKYTSHSDRNVENYNYTTIIYNNKPKTEIIDLAKNYINNNLLRDAS